MLSQMFQVTKRLQSAAVTLVAVDSVMYDWAPVVENVCAVASKQLAVQLLD